MKYNSEDLYEHIGYLFYSIACEGARISARNLLKLNQFVDATWSLTICADPGLSKHLTECIHRGIRYASVNGMSENHAFDSFSVYFIIHTEGFGSALKEGILSSVDRLLEEFPQNLKADEIVRNLRRLLASPEMSVGPVVK